MGSSPSKRNLSLKLFLPIPNSHPDIDESLFSEYVCNQYTKFSLKYPTSWSRIEYDMLIYFFSPIQCSYEDRGLSRKKDNINIQVHATSLGTDDFIKEWFDSANIRELTLLEREENIFIDGKQAKRVVIKCKFLHGITIIQKTYFIEAKCGLLYTASYTSNCGMPNDYIFEYMIHKTASFPTYIQSQWNSVECDKPYLRVQYPAMWSHEQVNYFFSPIQLSTRNRVKEQFAMVYDQTESPDLMSDIIAAVKDMNTGVVIHYSHQPCRISNVRALKTFLSHDFPEEGNCRLQKLVYTVPAREKFKYWMFLYVSSCNLKSLELWDNFLSSIELGYSEPSDDEFQFWDNLIMKVHKNQYTDLIVTVQDGEELDMPQTPSAATIAANLTAIGTMETIKRTLSSSSMSGFVGLRRGSIDQYADSDSNDGITYKTQYNEISLGNSTGASTEIESKILNEF